MNEIKCKWRTNKPKLDPKKVEAIRNANVIAYLIEIRKQDGIWKDCIKAIDSMNHKLKQYEDLY